MEASLPVLGRLAVLAGRPLARQAMAYAALDFGPIAAAAAAAADAAAEVERMDSEDDGHWGMDGCEGDEDVPGASAVGVGLDECCRAAEERRDQFEAGAAAARAEAALTELLLLSRGRGDSGAQHHRTPPTAQLACSKQTHWHACTEAILLSGANGVFATAALTQELQMLLPAALASPRSSLLSVGEASGTLLRTPAGAPLVAALALNVAQVRLTTEKTSLRRLRMPYATPSDAVTAEDSDNQPVTCLQAMPEVLGALVDAWRAPELRVATEAALSAIASCAPSAARLVRSCSEFVLGMWPYAVPGSDLFLQDGPLAIYQWALQHGAGTRGGTGSNRGGAPGGADNMRGAARCSGLSRTGGEGAAGRARLAGCRAKRPTRLGQLLPRGVALPQCLDRRRVAAFYGMCISSLCSLPCIVALFPLALVKGQVVTFSQRM